MNTQKSNKMTMITLKNEQEFARAVKLQAGALTIGRAGDNDFPLDDTTVSSHHAKIFTYFDASYIQDLGSTNGTYINGKRVQKHTLHPGDVVKVGQQMLEVVIEEQLDQCKP